MATKKRLSLAEIQKEDSKHNDWEQTDMIAADPVKVVRKQKAAAKMDLEGDMTKMSIIVSTNVFEKLQDLSRQRRRSKQPFKLTELVREALSEWLPKQQN